MRNSRSEGEKVSRAAGVVSLFTLLSRVLGLIRDMVIAALFGSGLTADAFFVAFRIPNLLRRLFAEGSLTIAFIPVFTEYLTRKGKDDAFEMARVVLTLLSLALVIITVLGLLFSPWIVRIQAFGFGGSGMKYDLTVLLTRITFPYIFFISLVAFFMGILNSLRHFAAPAAAPILLNVGIIGGAFLISPHLSEPIAGVAMGVFIGGFLQVVLQIPWVVKSGMRLLPLWMPGHPAVRRIGRLMLPAVFGSAVYQFNQFMGTLLASFLPEGSISWLYYADRVVQFPLGVFAIAISTAVLPSLSGHAAEKDLDEFNRTLSYALRLVFFVTIPATLGLIVLGRPIISILFERGAFSAHATSMTGEALFYYAVGLWAFSGIRILVSAFYALQDTKTPVKVAVVALVVNIALSLALMGPLRHGGLALALSLASGVQFVLLVLFLFRRVKTLAFTPILVSALRSGVASVIMALAVFYAKKWWLVFNPEAGVLRNSLFLAVLVLLGAGIYLVSSRILRAQELRSLRDMFHTSKRKKEDHEQ
ncbi:MAG: murein biosynthesis integral membrane protein MurJ [Deltaproteobacteria bacterium]|nr:murein biosynthesis integral membrane protein MurJ [Deltaproteobacteria bacterium]